MSAQYFFFSLKPMHQHRQKQNAFTDNRFFMCFKNLRVKPSIIKTIENNIFECMTYRFYILLLFNFIFYF